MKTLSELAQQTALVLIKNDMHLTTAESCTGGGISYWLTSIPGSSAWFERGFVTYTNTAKMEMLAVNNDTLKQFGAVSRETALEMVAGALSHSHATVAMSVTGIAGPDGGSIEKPVGTVWIAWQIKGQAGVAKCFHFTGDRQAIRDQTIAYALMGMIEMVNN